MKPMPRTAVLLAVAGVLLLLASASGQTETVAPADAAQGKPVEDEVAKLTVTITSSADGSPQKALFYVPEAMRANAEAKPAPLLVALHTWSYQYDQCISYVPDAKRRQWVLIAPDFRGRNNRPEACASALAIQDVIDAVAYAAKNARVDKSRVYLVGTSGGGHMSLMMAAKAPTLWAGVSAWVPITDLAAWHRECVAAERGYWRSLERICGGPPGPMTAAQYRARSPLVHLAAAKGLPIDLNAGIHDGHTGAVPVSHSLLAYNVLAAANGHKDRQLTDKQIAFMVREERVGDSLSGPTRTDPERKKAVLFRRAAGSVRITIFEGGHECEVGAALDWLARQRKGAAGAQTEAAGATRRVHVFVSGRVQGVGFRNFTTRNARQLGLTGWVRNLADRRVEAVIEGPTEKVAELLKLIHRGPPPARVEKVDVTDQKPTGEFKTFDRRR